MFSRIPLTPSMDPSAQAAAVNQNFEQLAAENRTKTIKNEKGVAQLTIGKYEQGKYGIVGYDLDGKRRILIGSAPSDGRIGIWVSKPDLDVIEKLGG